MIYRAPVPIVVALRYSKSGEREGNRWAHAALLTIEVIENEKQNYTGPADMHVGAKIKTVGTRMDYTTITVLRIFDNRVGTNQTVQNYPRRPWLLPSLYLGIRSFSSKKEILIQTQS